MSEAARREVLGRLLKPRHQRCAEKVAQGLHEKGRVGTGGNPGQAGGERGSGTGGQAGRQLSLGEALE